MTTATSTIWEIAEELDRSEGSIRNAAHTLKISVSHRTEEQHKQLISFLKKTKKVKITTKSKTNPMTDLDKIDAYLAEGKNMVDSLKAIVKKQQQELDKYTQKLDAMYTLFPDLR